MPSKGPWQPFPACHKAGGGFGHEPPPAQGVRSSKGELQRLKVAGSSPAGSTLNTGKADPFQDHTEGSAS